MSTETASTASDSAINVDEVGDVFIPYQDVIIRFMKKGDDQGVNQYTSKKGKPMLKLNYEIVSPEKGEVQLLDDNMEFIKNPDDSVKRVQRTIADKQFTEYWMIGADTFQDKQLKKLLALSGVGTTGNLDCNLLADGRLEGKAYKVRFGHKLQARKDEHGQLTGEKSLNGSISKVIEAATSYNFTPAAA